MQAVVSGVMTIVYGIYYFIPTETICVANSAEYTPSVYNQTNEIETLLDRPGASNVTEDFYLVIEFGFWASLTAVLYKIFWIFFKSKNYSSTDMIFSLCIKIALLAQFIMLCIFRYSHAGSVCSGDYKNYVYTKDGD